jgi:hypothetical protein
MKAYGTRSRVYNFFAQPRRPDYVRSRRGRVRSLLPRHCEKRVRRQLRKIARRDAKIEIREELHSVWIAEEAMRCVSQFFHTERRPVWLESACSSSDLDEAMSDAAFRHEYRDDMMYDPHDYLDEDDFFDQDVAEPDRTTVEWRDMWAYGMVTDWSIYDRDDEDDYCLCCDDYDDEEIDNDLVTTIDPVLDRLDEKRRAGDRYYRTTKRTSVSSSYRPVGVMRLERLLRDRTRGAAR